MSSSEWRKRISVGSPVSLDGVSYLVDEMSSGWVTLRSYSGEKQRMTLKQLVIRITDVTAPPPVSERLHDVESRISGAQAKKIRERRAIIRWFETGLRPEQNDEASPDVCHDPKVIISRHARIAAIAEVLAAKKGIELASAKKHVNRILDKATLGETGLYDPRLSAPLKVAKHHELESKVREYLLDNVFRSTTTNMTKYLSFIAWVQHEHGEEKPSKRTFERALQNVYHRYPHLKQKAKSRASAAQAPKVSLERRFAMRPGEFWFIDATPSNVMVRDPYAPNSKPRNYRLSLIKIMDGATRVIVGSSVSEVANGYGAGLAIADAFRRMHEESGPVLHSGQQQTLTVGLPSVLSRWPIPPRRLLLDNGREFLNTHMMKTLHRLGIDVEPQRVRDARGKGRLERFFGTYRSNFEELQFNYISGSVEGRGSEADQEVILTWDELFARDQIWTEMYNNAEHRGLASETGRRISPAQRWIELADECGTLEVTAWKNEWIRFLPNQILRLNPYGVVRRGMVYNSAIIEALIQVDGAAPGGKVRIFWDPSDLRQVYCFDPQGNAYRIPWEYLKEETEPFSDYTLDWANKRLEGGSLSKDDYRDRLADLVLHWQQEDNVLLVELRGKKNAQEIHATQLESLRKIDSGSIITAEPLINVDLSRDIQFSGGTNDYFDDGTDLIGNIDDDDLFGVFD